MNEQNRRKNPRVKLDVFVGETSGGKYFLPLAADISEDGILIESPSGLELPIHSNPIVEFALPDVKGLIWARCRILRTKSHGFFEGRALQFINIAAVDRQRIRHFISRRCGVV